MPEFRLSTTSGNHTINHVRGTDKTTSQPGTMFPHLIRAKYIIKLHSLNNSCFLHINHHMQTFLTQSIYSRSGM